VGEAEAKIRIKIDIRIDLRIAVSVGNGEMRAPRLMRRRSDSPSIYLLVTDLWSSSIAFPPIVAYHHPIIASCYMGIDMATRDELIAAHKTVAEVLVTRKSLAWIRKMIEQGAQIC